MTTLAEHPTPPATTSVHLGDLRGGPGYETAHYTIVDATADQIDTLLHQYLNDPTTWDVLIPAVLCAPATTLTQLLIIVDAVTPTEDPTHLIETLHRIHDTHPVTAMHLASTLTGPHSPTPRHARLAVAQWAYDHR